MHELNMHNIAIHCTTNNALLLFIHSMCKKSASFSEFWLTDSFALQLIKPEEMCNPKVDDLSMMTYLSQFPNAKLKPGAPLRPKTNPARVRAYGPGEWLNSWVSDHWCVFFAGIEPTGNSVGAPARFTVETFSAGRGELEITVLNPKGGKETVSLIVMKAFSTDLYISPVDWDHLQQWQELDVFLCLCAFHGRTVQGWFSYSKGNFFINFFFPQVIVKFANKEVPKSPYPVGVSAPVGDPSKVLCRGPGIEKTGVVVKKKTYFEVFTKGTEEYLRYQTLFWTWIFFLDAGQGVVDVGIVDPSGKKDTVRPFVVKKADDVWYVEYIPLEPGLHSVNVFFIGQPVPKSPYGVGVGAGEWHLPNLHIKIFIKFA